MQLRTFGFLLLVTAMSCARSEYRVDQLDNGKTLPLKFDSVSGTRNGDQVQAEVRFVDGTDSIRLDLSVHLSPSADCTSASYHADISGQAMEGPASCESLAFQGGQDAPAIGGVFVLKDVGGHAKYRITMPSTQIQRRFAP